MPKPNRMPATVNVLNVLPAEHTDDSVTVVLGGKCTSAK